MSFHGNIYYYDELINYWLHTYLLPMIDKVDYYEVNKVEIDI